MSFMLYGTNVVEVSRKSWNFKSKQLSSIYDTLEAVGPENIGMNVF
jgi:hypothetical protein